MGVWQGMWEAASSGLMFILGAAVLVVVIKFILQIIGMGGWNQFVMIVGTIAVFSLVLVKLWTMLDTVDTQVQKGKPAAQVQTQQQLQKQQPKTP